MDYDNLGLKLPQSVGEGLNGLDCQSEDVGAEDLTRSTGTLLGDLGSWAVIA